MLGSQRKAPKLTLLSYIEQLFHKESIETTEHFGQNIAFNSKCNFSANILESVLGQNLD